MDQSFFDKALVTEVYFESRNCFITTFWIAMGIELKPFTKKESLTDIDGGPAITIVRAELSSWTCYFLFKDMTIEEPGTFRDA